MRSTKEAVVDMTEDDEMKPEEDRESDEPESEEEEAPRKPPAERDVRRRASVVGEGELLWHQLTELQLLLFGLQPSFLSLSILRPMTNKLKLGREKR